jgi:hypothetical protein
MRYSKRSKDKISGVLVHVWDPSLIIHADRSRNKNIKKMTYVRIYHRYVQYKYNTSDRTADSEACRLNSITFDSILMFIIIIND